MPDTDPLPKTATMERPLATVLDRVADPEPDAETPVSLDDLLDRLGNKSFNTLMLVPAVLVVTPLSAIPGFSTLCGILIASAAVQNLLGREHIYLPRWMCRRSVGEGRLTAAIERVRRPVRWLDRQTRPRLEALVQPPFSTVAVAIAGLCGAVMPFLEFIPLSSSIMGAAVLFIALGLMARDGLVMLAAVVPLSVIGWIGFAAFALARSGVSLPALP